MAGETLLAQVKGLELQLTVLKAQMQQIRAAEAVGPLADLEGMLTDSAQSTEEEVEAAEYRPKWDGVGGAGK